MSDDADPFARYLHPNYCPEGDWTCRRTRDLVAEILSADLGDSKTFRTLNQKARDHVYARALLFVRAVDAQVDDSINKCLEDWLG